MDGWTRSFTGCPVPLGRSVLTTGGLALGGGGIPGLKVRSAYKLANGDSATSRGISLAPRVFVSVGASNDRDSPTPTKGEKGLMSVLRFFTNRPAALLIPDLPTYRPIGYAELLHAYPSTRFKKRHKTT
jgi:hypothetical protein